MMMRECELSQRPLFYKDSAAFEAIRHLPVSRTGFRHCANDANAGYRRAELAVWNAALSGERNRIVLNFIWHVEARVLPKVFAALDWKMKPQVVAS